MKIQNPYNINTGNITINTNTITPGTVSENRHTVHGANIHANEDDVNTSNIKIDKIDILNGNLVKKGELNCGYYDDTKIKERISLLEHQVHEIQQTDVNFNYRLSLLENIDHSQFALKSDIQRLDDRIDDHETTPCGLTYTQIKTIFN